MQLLPLFSKMGNLLLMILLGFAAARLHITGPESNRRISPIVLNILLPATILRSVAVADAGVPNHTVYGYIGIMALMLVISFAVAWFAPTLLRVPAEDRGITRALLTFMNNAFVGLPVIEAVFGPESVFFGALLNIPFSLTLYTLGVYMICSTGSRAAFNWRAAFSAPMLATVLAAILFLTKTRIPGVLSSTLTMLSGATTPMSMLVIGTSLGCIPLKKALGNWRVYAAALVRLVVTPVIVWAILRLFVHDPLMLGVTTLMAACPSAMLITILCLRYGRDDTFASEVIFISTVLSGVTIPLLIWLLL